MYDCTKGCKAIQSYVSASLYVCEIQGYWAVYAAKNIKAKVYEIMTGVEVGYYQVLINQLYSHKPL